MKNPKKTFDFSRGDFFEIPSRKTPLLKKAEPLSQIPIIRKKFSYTPLFTADFVV